MEALHRIFVFITSFEIISCYKMAVHTCRIIGTLIKVSDLIEAYLRFKLNIEMSQMRFQPFAGVHDTKCELSELYLVFGT